MNDQATAIRHPAPTGADAAPPTDTADAANRLFVALARLNRMLRREAPALLGHSAVAALATVVTNGPLRSGDLAVREGVSPPTMTRVVGALEAMDYVVREPDPADRRASLIRATAQGEQFINGRRSARSQVIGEHLEQLSADHRALLFAALPALEALASED